MMPFPENFQRRDSYSPTRPVGYSCCVEETQTGHLHTHTAVAVRSENGRDLMTFLSHAHMPSENRRKNKANEALLDAERCVEVSPSWAKGYSRMGTALFRLGRHDKAAAAYSKGELNDKKENQTFAYRFAVRVCCGRAPPWTQRGKRSGVIEMRANFLSSTEDEKM